MMLAGYVAGNVRSQLVAGKKSDDPVAGFRGALSVYQVLQSRGLSMPVMDEVARAEREGTLDVWALERMTPADAETEQR